MKFIGDKKSSPIAGWLRLFAVALIYIFSADAVASGISTTDQPRSAHDRSARIRRPG